MKITARQLSLALATLFMGGLVLAFYTLYYSEAQGVPNRFYITLGITSIMGAAALVIALTGKNELIVYRDIKKGVEEGTLSQADSSHSTLTVEPVKAAIKAARNPDEVMQSGLSAICKQVEAGQGAYYHVETRSEKKFAALKAGYALTVAEENTVQFEAGEGLIGQAIITGQTLYLDEVPEGYVKIVSGLGSASPRYILIVAAINDNRVAGVVELAFFTPVTASQRKFVEEAAGAIAGRLAVDY